MNDKIRSIKLKSQCEIEPIDKIMKIQTLLKDEVAQRHYCIT